MQNQASALTLQREMTTEASETRKGSIPALGHSGRNPLDSIPSGTPKQKNGRRSSLNTKLLAHPSLKYSMVRAKMALGTEAPKEQQSEFSRKLVEFSQKQEDTFAASQLKLPADESIVSVAGLLDGNDIFRKVWDVVIALSLLYVSLITPFDISFLEDATSPRVIIVCNIVLDVVFGLDIVLNFFTVYHDKNTGLLIVSRREIARNYIFGWFIIDLLSILPFHTFFDKGASDDQDSSFHRLPQLIRVLRLSKLTKLLRVFRIRVILSRVEAQLGVHYGILNLSKSLVTILFASHWMACVWHMTTFVSDDPQQTWLQTAVLKPDSALDEKYIASLYWSVMTLTTIGYGDIVAVSSAERVLAIVFQGVAAVLFSMVIGNVSTLLGSFKREKRRYEEEMDRLNEYMEANRLPAQLRHKIQDFFQYKHSHTLVHNNNILSLLSAPLRGEVVLWGSRKMVEKISFFKDVDLEFMSTLAMHFTPEVYAPHNVIFKINDVCTGLYLVEAGFIQITTSTTISSDASSSRHVTTGDSLGEDVLVNRFHRTTAASITYSSVLKIMKAQLAEALHENATVAQKIKEQALCDIMSKAETVSAMCDGTNTATLQPRPNSTAAAGSAVESTALSSSSCVSSIGVVGSDDDGAAGCGSSGGNRRELLTTDFEDSGTAAAIQLTEAHQTQAATSETAAGTRETGKAATDACVEETSAGDLDDEVIMSVLEGGHDFEGVLFSEHDHLTSNAAQVRTLEAMSLKMDSLMMDIGAINADIDHTNKWQDNTEQQVGTLKAHIDSLHVDVRNVVRACRKTQEDFSLVVNYLDEIKDLYT